MTVRWLWGGRSPVILVQEAEVRSSQDQEGLSYTVRGNGEGVAQLVFALNRQLELNHLYSIKLDVVLHTCNLRWRQEVQRARSPLNIAKFKVSEGAGWGARSGDIPL